MTRKVKTANYSEAQIAELKSGYTGSDNVAEVAALAEKLGKTPASVRAKLSSMGLYKTAEKADSETDRVTKRVLVEKVGEIVGLSEAEVDGLEKATKSALEKVLARLS